MLKRFKRPADSQAYGGKWIFAFMPRKIQGSNWVWMRWVVEY